MYYSINNKSVKLISGIAILIYFLLFASCSKKTTTSKLSPDDFPTTLTGTIKCTEENIFSNPSDDNPVAKSNTIATIEAHLTFEKKVANNDVVIYKLSELGFDNVKPLSYEIESHSVAKNNDVTDENWTITSFNPYDIDQLVADNINFNELTFDLTSNKYWIDIDCNVQGTMKAVQTNKNGTQTNIFPNYTVPFHIFTFNELNLEDTKEPFTSPKVISGDKTTSGKSEFNLSGYTQTRELNRLSIWEFKN